MCSGSDAEIMRNTLAYVQAVRYVTLEMCNMTSSLDEKYRLLDKNVSYLLNRDGYELGSWQLVCIMNIQEKVCNPYIELKIKLDSGLNTCQEMNVEIYERCRDKMHVAMI